MACERARAFAGQLEIKADIELSGTVCADLSQIGHILGSRGDSSKEMRRTRLHKI